MPFEGNASILTGMCEGGCANIPFKRTRGIGMKVTSVRESIELCTESGWSAYDLALDGKVDKGKIEELGTLGTLTYLGMLQQPFYRIEQPLYMIKGLEGADQLRVAMLVGEEEILDRVREILEK